MGVWTLTIRLMTIPCYMEIMWVLTLTHLKQQLGLRNLVWNLSIPATVFNNEYTVCKYSFSNNSMFNWKWMCHKPKQVLFHRWHRFQPCSHGCYCWWFRNPANQLRVVVYPIIYRVVAHPRWCWISSTNYSMAMSRFKGFYNTGSQVSISSSTIQVYHPAAKKSGNTPESLHWKTYHFMKKPSHWLMEFIKESIIIK